MESRHVERTIRMLLNNPEANAEHDPAKNDGYKFNVGQHVISYSEELAYLGKCMGRRRMDEKSLPQYFIHYVGYKSFWDEWVDEDNIIIVHPINVQHMQILSEYAEKRKKEKRSENINQTKLHTSGSKTNNVEQFSEASSKSLETKKKQSSSKTKKGEEKDLHVPSTSGLVKGTKRKSSFCNKKDVQNKSNMLDEIPTKQKKQDPQISLTPKRSQGSRRSSNTCNDKAIQHKSNMLEEIPTKKKKQDPQISLTPKRSQRSRRSSNTCNDKAIQHKSNMLEEIPTKKKKQDPQISLTPKRSQGSRRSSNTCNDKAIQHKSNMLDEIHTESSICNKKDVQHKSNMLEEIPTKEKKQDPQISLTPKRSQGSRRSSNTCNDKAIQHKSNMLDEIHTESSICNKKDVQHKSNMLEEIPTKEKKQDPQISLTPKRSQGSRRSSNTCNDKAIQHKSNMLDEIHTESSICNKKDVQHKSNMLDEIPTKEKKQGSNTCNDKAIQHKSNMLDEIHTESSICNKKDVQHKSNMLDKIPTKEKKRGSNTYDDIAIQHISNMLDKIHTELSICNKKDVQHKSNMLDEIPTKEKKQGSNTYNDTAIQHISNMLDAIHTESSICNKKDVQHKSNMLEEIPTKEKKQGSNTCNDKDIQAELNMLDEIHTESSNFNKKDVQHKSNMLDEIHTESSICNQKDVQHKSNMLDEIPTKEKKQDPQISLTPKKLQGLKRSSSTFNDKDIQAELNMLDEVPPKQKKQDPYLNPKPGTSKERIRVSAEIPIVNPIPGPSKNLQKVLEPCNEEGKRGISNNISKEVLCDLEDEDPYLNPKPGTSKERIRVSAEISIVNPIPGPSKNLQKVLEPCNEEGKRGKSNNISKEVPYDQEDEDPYLNPKPGPSKERVRVSAVHLENTILNIMTHMTDAYPKSINPKSNNENNIQAKSNISNEVPLKRKKKEGTPIPSTLGVFQGIRRSTTILSKSRSTLGIRRSTYIPYVAGIVKGVKRNKAILSSSWLGKKRDLRGPSTSAQQNSMFGSPVAPENNQNISKPSIPDNTKQPIDLAVTVLGKDKCVSPEAVSSTTQSTKITIYRSDIFTALVRQHVDAIKAPPIILKWKFYSSSTTESKSQENQGTSHQNQPNAMEITPTKKSRARPKSNTTISFDDAMIDKFSKMVVSNPNSKTIVSLVQKFPRKLLERLKFDRMQSELDHYVLTYPDQNHSILNAFNCYISSAQNEVEMKNRKIFTEHMLAKFCDSIAHELLFPNEVRRDMKKKTEEIFFIRARSMVWTDFVINYIPGIWCITFGPTMLLRFFDVWKVTYPVSTVKNKVNCMDLNMFVALTENFIEYLELNFDQFFGPNDYQCVPRLSPIPRNRFGSPNNKPRDRFVKSKSVVSF